MTDEQQPTPRWRKFITPVLLLVLVLGLGWAFHHVLLPFLVAIFIVYLIEPIVARIARLKVGGKNVPRWAAVIAVYLTMLAVVSIFSIVFVPQLGREFTSLANTAPEFFRELREERLPAFQERIDRLLEHVSAPTVDDDGSVDAAQSAVDNALEHASVRSILAAGLSEDERLLFEAGGLPVAVHTASPVDESAVLRIRPVGQGELQVMLGEDALHIEQVDEGTYRITAGAPEADDEGSVNIEAAIDEQLGRFVETSGEVATELIGFGQRLVASIINVFVTLVITLMVAAFISIDVPGILRFIRSLFPEESQATVSKLLQSLDRGLAGVIRGQLMICLVNGILTGVGLMVLGVKFALILALIAGALSLIPIFGTIISTIPAVAVGLTQSFMTGVLVLVWILIIHFIEANILNPKIIGTTAHIHPAIIVFALLAGEHSFGLIGALLAVPTASILQTLFLFVRDQVRLKSGDAAEAVDHAD